jgi:hypothetical protein
MNIYTHFVFMPKHLNDDLRISKTAGQGRNPQRGVDLCRRVVQRQVQVQAL